jgi:uncharacterized protein YggT (Ycf19 family)
MLTDLIAEFILLFSRLLALLFLVKAAGQFFGRPSLGILRPFAPWMEPMLSRVRTQVLRREVGFDLSPLAVAFFILLVGSLLAWLF